MNRIISIIFLTFLSVTVNANDYAIIDQTTQKFDVKEIKEVELHCFCSNNIIMKRVDSTMMKLEITAKMGSIGYHGEQTKPKGIASELLEFDSEQDDGVLVLISKEYTFMHHAFIVKSLVVHVPRGIKYRVIPIHPSTLKGRNSGT